MMQATHVPFVKPAKLQSTLRRSHWIKFSISFQFLSGAPKTVENKSTQWKRDKLQAAVFPVWWLCICCKRQKDCLFTGGVCSIFHSIIHVKLWSEPLGSLWFGYNFSSSFNSDKKKWWDLKQIDPAPSVKYFLSLSNQCGKKKPDTDVLVV